MPFEDVYRVSTRNAVPEAADVDALGRELGMELAFGYREFVTAFGPGTLSDFLVVKMPSEIRSLPGCIDATDREILACTAQGYREDKRACVLAPDDIEQAFVFAYAAAEEPIWIASRRSGPRLFEQVEGDVFGIPGGFFGLVESCTARQGHTFPFFEPRNGRRRMRVHAIRPGISPKGFIESMARRWGREDLRCSRPSAGEQNPHYFVPAIEGHVELLLWKSNGLPPDSFYVRARYDIDWEADFATFVEPLLLPGGGPHDFMGESW